MLKRCIRYNEAVSILRKVLRHDVTSFSKLVSQEKPFGIRTHFKDYKKEEFAGSVKFFTYGNVGYVSRSQITQNKDWVDRFKVFISMAYGERISSSYWVIGKPFIGEPGTCCSESYLVVGPFDSRETCENVMSYMRTRFFRFLVLLKKPTQHASAKVYGLVPMQDFSKPWTDEELYQKYGLTEDEIAFIESMVRPMPVGGNGVEEEASDE